MVSTLLLTKVADGCLAGHSVEPKGRDLVEEEQEPEAAGMIAVLPADLGRLDDSVVLPAAEVVAVAVAGQKCEVEATQK